MHALPFIWMNTCILMEMFYLLLNPECRGPQRMVMFKMEMRRKQRYEYMLLHLVHANVEKIHMTLYTIF